MGWIGGRYTTSKPISAIAGSRCAAVRKVPLTGGLSGSTTAPSERGKNSYQEPYSARSRSTSNGSRRADETISRRGWRARTWSTSGVSAAARRAVAGRSVSRRAATAARIASRRPLDFGTPAAARSYSSAPSSRTSSVSMPAGILIRAWRRQVVIGSPQASTV
jgi:hypothetical protein